ncbi:MAG TPA: metallophosphoesterase [Bacilli bacterium]|nr:metallophosphoesterase [Bacilli bacterium]
MLYKYKEVSFVVGDLHFGDEGLFNLVYFRDFLTKEAYIEQVITNYNKIVAKNAVVIFLGDLGRKDALEKYIPRLNGYKILILGNHDEYAKSFYQKLFAEVYDHPLFITKRIVLSHEPIPVEPGVINIHGHTHYVFLESEEHFNYCIEHTNYTPVRFKQIMNLLPKVAKPRRKFLEEWYRDKQIWQGPVRSDLVLDEQNKIDVVATLKKREEE